MTNMQALTLATTETALVPCFPNWNTGAVRCIDAELDYRAGMTTSALEVYEHGQGTAKPTTECTSVWLPVLEARNGTQLPTSCGETALAPSKFCPPIATRTLHVDPQTRPIQIWEGTVVGLDEGTNTLDAILTAKMGEVPRHSAKINLQWVAEQDRDLVSPGAVFYLTLFKRTLRGSIQNSQELRFRRRPSWSSAQIQQINQAAQALLNNMSPLPIAE